MKKLVCFLTCVIVCFFAQSCANQTKFSTNVFCFNTSVRIEVYSKPLSNELDKQIHDLLLTLDEQLSLSKDNCVSSFNNAGKNQPVQFSDVAFSLLKKAVSYNELTGGLFDVTVYPLVSLWGLDNRYPVESFKPPNSDAIQQALSFVGCEYIELNEQDKTVTKLNSNVKIDFGAIAKGYAVQLVKELLLNNGYLDGYINVGGSSLHILSLKNQNNYLGVRHPRNTSSAILNLHSNVINGKSVSTSGDYNRYYEFDGNRYSHLINPLTGAPSNTGVISATILGEDACLLDALSTALFFIEHDPVDTNSSPLVLFAKNLCENYSNVSVVIVYQKGEHKQIITNRTLTDFTLFDQTYSVISIN